MPQLVRSETRDQDLTFGIKLRRWQQRLLHAVMSADAYTFLANVCPGAGKTIAAGTIARQHLSDGTVDHVFVVVPLDTLRDDWPSDVTSLGLNLRRYKGDEFAVPGFHGTVVTYQELAAGTTAGDIRTFIGAADQRVLVILDEPHHTADDAGWSTGLSHAFEYAVKFLLLSGTPFRTDNNQIWGAIYDDDNRIRCDFTYSYGEAIQDQVCRGVGFHAYNGEAEWSIWRDDKKIKQSAVVADGLSEGKRSAALRTLYDADMPWIKGVFGLAYKTLQDKRSYTVALNDEIRLSNQHKPADERVEKLSLPAMLIVTDGIAQARNYANRIHKWIGIKPPVVVSEDGRAKPILQSFRHSDDPIIIAVKMISEGVNIPRLAVGLWASVVKTKLNLRQIVGRTSRHRDGEPFNFIATWFIPADPTLVQMAYEIETESRHALKQIQPGGGGGGGGGGGVSTPPVPERTTAPELSESVQSGDGYDPEDMEKARVTIDETGEFTEGQLFSLARIFKKERLDLFPQRVPSSNEPIQSEEEKCAVLSLRINDKASWWDNQQGWDAGTTNKKLWKRRGGRHRPGLGLSELQEEFDFVCSGRVR